ncbi:hypothetical protein ACSSNL_00390 [Thalassobius sp. S69A]|uniref:hypothetical protein n=1 Tax=unclassified Thalassovita TaxID=2619711 RepID=UPI003C7A8209
MKLSLTPFALIGALVSFVPALAQSGTAIPLPDPAFAPEGISADADGNLYTGSLTQGRLIAISAKDHSVRDFAPAGANGMVTVVGLHVAGDTVFACSSDPGISALTGTAAPALVAFDRVTGAASGRYELPAGGAFCNDIAQLPDGTILATDSFAPRIYALAPGGDQLEIWLEDAQFSGEGFNLNGIAYDDGAVYALRYNTGTLHRIAIEQNGQSGAVSQVALPRNIHGADGLTALGNGRFLIVEGGGLSAGATGALLGVTLNGDAATIDTIAADLNVPTTATVIGTQAYVIEGQLDHLFDPSAGPADPYRILKIQLPAAYR